MSKKLRTLEQKRLALQRQLKAVVQAPSTPEKEKQPAIPEPNIFEKTLLAAVRTEPA